MVARMFGDGRRGQYIGRYRIVERLGGGGMGVVYRAFDPKLRRDVALKRLRSPSVGQIVDEARAMARLAHPNVVAVFDAEGEASGEGGFVVMELVPGTTLERWLADAPRRWQEVVAMFVGAGRGLAAAHAAGVLHRDFKPANVLIGHDGRPRVADFGIAAPLSPVGDGADTWGGVGDVSCSGLVHGTRGYLAPERLQGQRATPASDQFAFCVSLSEALARASTPIPRSIGRIVARGVASDPARRWPSMERLVDALSARNKRRRTGMVLGVGVAAAALVIGGGRSAPQQCEAVEGIEVVDPQQQRAVAESLRRFARPVAERLAAELDGYVAQWTTMRTEVCKAATTDTPAQPDLPRLECMQGARDALVAVVEQLVVGPEVSRADRLLSSLPNLDACRGPQPEAATPLPADASGVRTSRRVLARVRAMRLAGDLSGASAELNELVDAVDEVDFPPLHTEVALEQGLLALTHGSYDDAEQQFARARSLGTETSQWREVARATTAKMHLMLARGGQAKEALLLADMARGLVKRRPEQLYDVEVVIAQSHFILGDDQKAERGFRLALEHAQATDDRRRVAKARGELARVYSFRGSHTAAVEEQLEALAIYRELEGEDSSNTAYLHSMIATTLRSQGELLPAEQHARRAVAIRRRINEPGDPRVADARSQLAQVLRDLRKYDESIDHVQWALDRYDALGNRLMAARARWNLAMTLLEQDRYAAAYEVAKRGLEDARAASDGETTVRVVLLRTLGVAQWGLGDEVGALRNLRAAMAMVERLRAPGHLPATRSVLARFLLDSGKPAEAAELNRLALEELSDTQWAPGWIAGIVARQGLALHESGELDEAERAYRKALDMFPDDKPGVEDDRAWCQIHLARLRAQRGSDDAIRELETYWDEARQGSPTKVRSAAAFALARALWATDGARALRLGRKALAAHSAEDPLMPGKRAEIRAWLENPEGW